MKGTLSISCGEWGGFYRYRAKGEHLSTVRVCCGWVAITYIGGIELDELMKGYGDAGDLFTAMLSYFDGQSSLSADHRALYEAFERARGRP